MGLYGKYRITNTRYDKSGKFEIVSIRSYFVIMAVS